MVYHFFSKWKGSSLKSHIEEAEKVYKNKVILFKLIWDTFRHGQIDVKNVKLLLRQYKKNLDPYGKILAEVDHLRQTNPSKDLDQFWDVIFQLQESSTKERDLSIKLLNTLDSGELPEVAMFYQLQDLLKRESLFLQIEEKEFNKIEEVFLILQEPGAGSGKYLMLKEAVARGILTFSSPKLYWQDKEVQGVLIKDNMVSIKGDHYAPRQNAEWIANDRYVEPGQRDPFSYFVEKGKFNGWSKAKISRALGIGNAEAVVSLWIYVYPEQCYVKVEQGRPIKFAINQLQLNQVHRVVGMVQDVA